MALLSTTLSYTGNQKALDVMSLGDYLKEPEKSPNVHRDSDQYHITIFGTPSAERFRPSFPMVRGKACKC